MKTYAMTFSLDGMNIELTNNCPLHCPQCYCPIEGGKDIDYRVAIHRIEEAAATGVKHIEFSGGETMCYPYLYDVVKAARSLGIAPSIAISGWHFDERTLEKLVDAGIDMIYVSLNGPTEQSNSLTRNGYSFAINALKVLQKCKFENTMINWVMHRSSVSFLPEMISLAESFGVGGILIIEPKPSAKGTINTYPTAEQMKYVANLVRQHGKSVELVIQHCFSPLLALASENRLWGNSNVGRYKGCTAGICSVAVNVDGDYIPCRHLDRQAECWDSLENYWNNSIVLRELRERSPSELPPCKNCRLKANCRRCPAIKNISDCAHCVDNWNCPLEGYTRISGEKAKDDKDSSRK